MLMLLVVLAVPVVPVVPVMLELDHLSMQLDTPHKGHLHHPRVCMAHRPYPIFCTWDNLC